MNTVQASAIEHYNAILFSGWLKDDECTKNISDMKNSIILGGGQDSGILITATRKTETRNNSLYVETDIIIPTDRYIPLDNPEYTYLERFYLPHAFFVEISGGGSELQSGINELIQFVNLNKVRPSTPLYIETKVPNTNNQKMADMRVFIGVDK